MSEETVVVEFHSPQQLTKKYLHFVKGGGVMGFCQDTQLDLGQTLPLRIEIPETKSYIDCQGQVVWLSVKSVMAQKGRQYGFQFIGDSASEAKDACEHYLIGHHEDQHKASKSDKNTDQSKKYHSHAAQSDQHNGET